MKKILLALLGVFVMGIAVAQQGNHWSPISGTQYNMTVKGVIIIDEVQQANNMLEIGAFCGDECRGSRKATLFPPTGDYIVTLAVVSNVVSGETITFRIYDHNAQQELELESLSTLAFTDNINVGDPTNWFHIAFATPVPPGFHFTTAGNWSEASNWQGGALPSATDVVFINAHCTLDQNAEVTDLTIRDGSALTLQTGRVLTVSGTLTNTAEDGLVIEDGAQVINGSADVRATYRKDITSYNAKDADGWYTISSPVSEMSIAGSAFVTPEYDLYRYNETRVGGEWENHKDNSNTDFTSFETGRGYLYANSNTFSPAFTGTLNNADVSRHVTYTDRPDGLSGFNLIGNPFPHAIYKGAGGAIDDVQLASGYYTLTDEGAWHVHTYEDAIQPGQGILVKTTSSADLSIVKSTAVATAETSSSKSAVGRLGITVTGSNIEDRTFVYFGQGIGMEKMGNLSQQAPSLWIRNDGADYAIVHVDNACESLDVCFRNRHNADYRLAVDVKGLDLSVLQLVDHATGEVIDLKQQPDYSFHANGTEVDGRFKLVFRVDTGVEEVTEAEPFAFISDGQLVVNGQGTLQVIDPVGRIVKCEKTADQPVSISKLSSGVYVLRLIGENKVRTQKIVVR